MEKNRLKILAIDDNQDNLTSVKALIKEAFPNALILMATEAGKGIELAQTENPDVILLDVVMPGMDGFEICRKLKSDPQTRDIPVVFLTAIKGDRESRIRALEVGAEAFLAKPIDEIELIAQIRAMQKIKAASERERAEKETLTELVAKRTRELDLAQTAALNLLEDLREENESRRKSEETARENEEKWRSLVNASPDFIALHDSEGRFLFLNHYAEGFTEKEVIGSSVYQYQSPESVELFRSYTEIALNTWSPQHFEHKAMGENGTSKTYDEYIIPLRGKDQEINFMAVARDITERKQAEAALRESEASLAEAQRIAHIGSWDWDLTSNITRWSQEMYQVFDLEPGTNDGTPEYILKTVHPEDVEIVTKSMNANLWSGNSNSIEYRVIHKDGSIHYLLAEGRLAFDEAGKIIRNFGTIQDITERKQAEQKLHEYSEHLEEMVIERTRELRETQEQLVLKEKLAVLGQIAGGVAHELRNPLGIILNAIYYLKLVQPEANEKVCEYHGMIEQEAHNAEKIITELLDFARVTSADREPVSVPELVQRILEHHPAPPSVQVALKLAADLPKVYVDSLQMEQVLGNLVVNAYQAMSNGGTLIITTHRRKEMVTIAVKDTGVGIPPENMPKLFEPLFSTKITGIGLGLAVSKKLIEANDGRIEVESEPGKGSAFTVTLPIHNK